jgi:hypothetical protein
MHGLALAFCFPLSRCAFLAAPLLSVRQPLALRSALSAASQLAVNLPIIEGVIKSAALSGSVLCFSAATALYLCSDQFSSYLEEVRKAHDAHLRVHHK